MLKAESLLVGPDDAGAGKLVGRVSSQALMPCDRCGYFHLSSKLREWIGSRR